MQLAPVANEIGQLDTPESYQFLKNELQTAKSTCAEVCAEAMLYSTQKEAVPFALKGYGGRAPPLRSGLLKGLATTPNDLQPYARLLLGIARREQNPEVRQYLPQVLLRLDTPAAAKLMLSAVTAPKQPDASGLHGQFKYNDAVAEALSSSKNEKVRAWLTRGAFKSARSDAMQLRIVALVAGSLELEEARPALEKTLKHRDPFTAAAAAAALGKIGVTPSVDKLIAVLEKGKVRKDPRFRATALDVLATSDDERALAFLLEVAGSEDRALKAIVMGSLISTDSPEALQAVLAALEDTNVSVRAVALLSLAKKRSKAMIGPLIDCLGAEKNERLRIHALKLLVNLTAVNMELNMADWRKWWKEAEAGFELSEESEAAFGTTLVRRQTAEDVQIIPKFFGMEVARTNRAIFIADVSGSMTREVVLKNGDRVRKIDALKKELAQVIEKLSEATHVNIIAFSSTFTPWRKHLVPLRGSGRRQALQYVRALRARRSTNVYDTLEFALQDREVDTIFILSDGYPSAGRYVDTDSILREIKVLNRSRGVSINGIAFGEQSHLLERLAAENNGEYKFIETEPAG